MGVKTYIIALLILLCFPFIYAASSSSSINWLTCGGLADGVCPYAYFETMTVINKTTVNENVTGALNVAGNVGIGTTASQHKLEVAGSMNVSGGVNISNELNVVGNVNINGTTVISGVITNSTSLMETSNRYLKIYMPFEDSNSIVRDLSGNNYDGVVTGADRVSGVNGRGNAYYFTTSETDSINTPTLNLNLTTKTVSFWYKLNVGEAPTNYEMFEMTGIAHMAKQSTNPWEIYMYNTTGKLRTRCSTCLETTGTGTWQHVAFVLYWNGGQPTGVAWYKNGVLFRNATPDYYGAGVMAIGGLHIGSNPNVGAVPYNGTLDNFRVYDTALSSEEIKIIYREEELARTSVSGPWISREVLGVDSNGTISFKDDSNTRIRPNNDTIIFETGGSERARVNNSGFSTPQTNTTFGNLNIIEYNSTCVGFRYKTTGGLILSCEDSTTCSDYWLDEAGDNCTGDLNVAGNVGIGTTKPSHKLEVAGSMNVSGNINLSGCIFMKGEQVCNWSDVNASSGFSNPATENLDMNGLNITNITNGGMSIVGGYTGGEEDVNITFPNINGNLHLIFNDGGNMIEGLYVDASSTACTVWSGSMRIGEKIHAKHRVSPDSGWAGFVWSTANSCSTYNEYFSIGEDTYRDQSYINLHSDSNLHLVIGSSGISNDFDHSNLNNAWLYLHANTDPDTDNTQWLGLAHNKSDGLIRTGKGDLRLEPSSGLVWIQNNISYDTAFDRTPAYKGTSLEALQEVLATDSVLTPTGDREIDHSTLPEMVKAKIKKINRVNCTTLCMNCSVSDCESTTDYSIPFKLEYTNLSPKEFQCNEFCDEEITYEDARNTGAMITVQTEAIKALNDKIEQLEARIAILEKG